VGVDELVAGYVVMRVPMIFLWARAARHDPARRPAAMTYIWTIASAQVFWVVLAIVDLPIGATVAIGLVLVGIEMLGPFVAERRRGRTPWHAPHRRALRTVVIIGYGDQISNRVVDAIGDVAGGVRIQKGQGS
jgi:hypothetical protein